MFVKNSYSFKIPIRDRKYVRNSIYFDTSAHWTFKMCVVSSWLVLVCCCLSNLFHVCLLVMYFRNTNSQSLGTSNHSIPLGKLVYDYFHKLYPHSYRLFSLTRINVYRVCCLTNYYVNFKVDSRKCMLIFISIIFTSSLHFYNVNIV